MDKVKIVISVLLILILCKVMLTPPVHERIYKINAYKDGDCFVTSDGVRYSISIPNGLDGSRVVVTFSDGGTAADPTDDYIISIDK